MSATLGKTYLKFKDLILFSGESLGTSHLHRSPERFLVYGNT